jgi:hypothetical protein
LLDNRLMIRVLTLIPTRLAKLLPVLLLLATIPLVLFLLVLAPLPARAYSCELSPARDAIIIKTDNASDHAMTCRVECTFTSPDGPVTMACVREVPPDTRDWYVCLRPTGGKALEFAGGSESCK